VTTTSISIPQGLRGRYLYLRVHYRYDGDDNDIKWVARDETNGASTEVFVEKTFSTTSKTAELAFFIKDDAASIIIGPQVSTHATGSEVILWTEVEISTNPANIVELQDSQSSMYTGIGTDLLDRTNEVRFNLGGFAHAGGGIYILEDDPANTRTKIIALKDCNIHTSFSSQMVSVNKGAGVYKGGVEVSTGTYASNAFTNAGVADSFDLLAGEYLSIGSSSDSVRNSTQPVLASITATSEIEGLVTSASAVSQISRYDGFTALATGSRVQYATKQFNEDSRGADIDELFESINNATVGTRYTALKECWMHASVGLRKDGGTALCDIRQFNSGGGNKNTYRIDVDTSGFTEAGGFIFKMDVGDYLDTSSNATLKNTASENYFTVYASPILPAFSVAIPLPKVAYIKDIKSSGTHAGTFTSGSFFTRDINSISGDSSFASVASNQFTLAPGIYDIKAHAPALAVDTHKAILRNVTDSTDDIIGTAMYASSGDFGFSVSAVEGRISLTSAKVFEIQHRCTTTRAPNGLGTASSYGLDEVYTTIKITQVRKL